MIYMYECGVVVWESWYASAAELFTLLLLFPPAQHFSLLRRLHPDDAEEENDENDAGGDCGGDVLFPLHPTPVNWFKDWYN